MKLALAELQSLIQRGILAGEGDALTLVRAPPRDTAAVMFGVYQNAYTLRLVEFLENDFEKLRLFMGEERFGAMARDYVTAHHSRTANARWYAHHLPAFLSTDPRYCAELALHDLSTLEQATNDAFDAADAPALSLADLAAVDRASIAAAVFSFASSVFRVSTKTSVADVWASLAPERPVPEVHELDAPAQIIVWRQNETSRFRTMTAEEAMAFDEAKSGVPFGVICEMIAMMDDQNGAAIRAASYLRSWIESGMICGIETYLS